MKYYIGIDLGGTNVRVAKVDENGVMIKDIIRSSRGTEGPQVINDNIIDILKEHDLSDVEGIGLAIPGPVDEERNVITQATNIPGCEEFPFAENIEKAFNKKVFLDNDANVAGLAEAMFGAGKGYKTVFYLTQSTGIGGGLIIDQKIHSGHKGYAGEVANIIVDQNAKQYPIYESLSKGCVESVASGTAIGLIGKETFGEKGDSAIKIFELMKDGNEAAAAIIDKMSKDFAVALLAISSVVAPDVFVIGGGCSKSHYLYFDKLEKYYKEYSHPGLRDIPIKKAELDEPGVIGAAMLAKSRMK